MVIHQLTTISVPNHFVNCNTIGQDMNLIHASLYYGIKLVPAGDGSEHSVMTKLTFIKFIQGWKELFSAGNLDTL